MKPVTSLKINQLELKVFLGWPSEERKRTQKVFLDIELLGIDFTSACHSDDLGDTVCYDELSQKIKKFVKGRQFKLIEALCMQIFELLKGEISENISLKVVVTKPKVPVEGLHGGSTFTVEDSIFRPWFK